MNFFGAVSSPSGVVDAPALQDLAKNTRFASQVLPVTILIPLHSTEGAFYVPATT